jgi:hypothetical protein
MTGTRLPRPPWPWADPFWWARKQFGAARLVVPGWDELSLGSIRARLRRLSEEDLVALHDYEENHAARPDVLSMLQNRLTKVRSEKLGSVREIRVRSEN